MPLNIATLSIIPYTLYRATKLRNLHMLKTLIYKTTNSGLRPHVTFVYKIYNTGEFVIRCTYHDEAPKILKKQIPESDIKKILDIIDKNSHLFSVKKVELADEMLTLDSSSTEIFFSDGQRSNTLYAIDSFALSLDKSVDYPNTHMLAQLDDSINKIMEKYYSEDEIRWY